MSEQTDSYVGIDYGMGAINRDEVAHYGCIHLHSLHDDIWDDLEPVYPTEVETTCPQCSHTFSTTAICDDDPQTCPECQHEFRDRSMNQIEPAGWELQLDEYETATSNHTTIIVKSPYYTKCVYCSPCVPGAGDLDSPHPEGVKTYCFGHEMFNDERAPYDVFLVADDSPVLPKV